MDSPRRLEATTRCHSVLACHWSFESFHDCWVTTDSAVKRPASSRRGANLQRLLRRDLTGYLFLAGAVICFAFFSWYPIYREIVMSFQKTNFAGTTTWMARASPAVNSVVCM